MFIVLVSTDIPVTGISFVIPKALRTGLMSVLRAGACALLASNASLALAQATQSPLQASGAGVLGEIVVVGTRASLASAQDIKRDKLEIVDSVVADDITKLPDFSVTDALQRVTGIQIARDRGEGANIAIRGLTQMETTLNGREVFTAGSGRNFDFADIASELISSINVYKTSAAEHIEGGVGGMIDLRTRRPFDFKGREVVASTRLIYNDLVDRSATQFSTLVSNRWKLDSSGEFGALVNVAFQDRSFREDQKSSGNPLTRTDLMAGQATVVPNGTTETSSLGSRKRSSANVVLQWRPSANLELYAEGNYAQFETRQNSYQMNVLASPTFAPGSPALFPGTNDVQRITWTNAPISTLSFARDTFDQTKQAAVGGVWSGKSLTLKSDVSYTKSIDTLFFSGLTMGGAAANFAQDQSASVPGTSVTGTNLLNPSNFQYTGISYRFRRFEGDQATGQFDGEYEFDDGFIKALMAGFRYSRRGANNGVGLIVGDASVTGKPVATLPQFATPNPYDFFPGSGSIGNYLVGNLDTARDAAGLRNAFGVTSPIPTTASPLSLWDIGEETQAAYFMARFNAANAALEGNVGLRAVHTVERVSGFRSDLATGSVAPVNVNSSYTDYLPSVNLRYELNPGLYLRASASKTLTRPNFDQLSPSLTLVPNAINPALNQGSAGNPELKPIRADNLDVAVEKYFNKSTAIYLTGFLKKVDGFVMTLSKPEVVDGVTYQVSRPQNSAAADIRGFETGYQQFYDFLPGWLGGLGMQANYTYVDSETFDSTLGEKVPLQNLSRNSLNLIGMYEKGRVSARIAYNWRDKFLSGVTNIVGVGALPIYTKAYGWLDASLSYRVNNNVSLVIAGSNLLGTVRSSYYGVETRPQSSWINDTQVSVSVTARF